MRATGLFKNILVFVIRLLNFLIFVGMQRPGILLHDLRQILPPVKGIIFQITGWNWFLVHWHFAGVLPCSRGGEVLSHTLAKNCNKSICDNEGWNLQKLIYFRNWVSAARGLCFT
jgi:hypothetical protein